MATPTSARLHALGWIVLWAAIAGFSLQSIYAQDVTFRGLGVTPVYSDTSTTTAVSGDGSVVVGFCVKPGGFGTQPFRWARTTGMLGLGNLSTSDDFGSALALSRDGGVIVGQSSRKPFIWTAAAGLKRIAESDPLYVEGKSKAITPDGTVVVGSANGSPFLWSESAGLTILHPYILNYFPGELVAVSSDGSVMAGNGEDVANVKRPYRLSQSEGATLLDILPGSIETTANAMSNDGNVIVGETYGNGLKDQAFRWTAAGVVGLGDFPGGNDYSSASAISADGSVVVGTGSINDPDHPSDGERAFRWDEQNGMQSVQSILEAYGVDLSGWTLSTATGISSDGRTIVGYGIHGSRNYEAWIATGVTALPKGRPTVHLFGKLRIVTDETHITLNGTAKSKEKPLKKVEVNVRNTRFHSAHGKAKWRYTAVLKPGRNKISIRAVDTRGIASEPIQLLVIRK